MENSFSHIFHSIGIAALMYLVLFYVLKQSRESSIDKSILIGGVILVYMTLFGHNLPSHGLNKNIL